MKTLIFIYNAKSDVWSKSLDMAHKIISPSTYACDLCSLTHGNFSENKLWKDFKKSTNVEFVFMYKNEFQSKYSNNQICDFPIVFGKQNQELTVIFDSKKLASFESTERLIEELQKEIVFKKSLAEN